jgi:hypothetical protein
MVKKKYIKKLNKYNEVIILKKKLLLDAFINLNLIGSIFQKKRYRIFILNKNKNKELSSLQIKLKHKNE